MMLVLMKSSSKQYVVALGLALLAFICSSCQTMKGAGKDIEHAGEKIQDNAERHQ